MDAKLRVQLADLALVLIREWWYDGQPVYIDGGWMQDTMERHSLVVAVPPGTHTDCKSCEDGLYDCGELVPALREALKERGAS